MYQHIIVIYALRRGDVNYNHMLVYVI